MFPLLEGLIFLERKTVFSQPLRNPIYCSVCIMGYNCASLLASQVRDLQYLTALSSMLFDVKGEQLPSLHREQKAEEAVHIIFCI